MKLVSFAIPSYNSQDYMDKCIESLLPGGDDVEILIVDDGSTDRTAEIADAYEAAYPGIVRAIHQENGGHGEAVNAGLRNATGLYYKVVDSDDWLDADAYSEYLKTLKKLYNEGTVVDMFLTNYVYEKVHLNQHHTMRYVTFIPTDRVIGWSDFRCVLKGFPILMHSVTYRTELLKELALPLPKHTFYVDNLFVFEPLPKVKTMYYLNVDMYRYFIGRAGQSVAEQTMVKRIDQQLAVNYRMIDAYDLKTIKEKNLRNYMLAYLELLTVVSTSIGYVSHDDEVLAKVEELWAYLRQKDAWLYKEIRFGMLGNSMRLPGGKAGREVSLALYHIAGRIFKFN